MCLFILISKTVKKNNNQQPEKAEFYIYIYSMNRRELRFYLFVWHKLKFSILFVLYVYYLRMRVYLCGVHFYQYFFVFAHYFETIKCLD